MFLWVIREVLYILEWQLTYWTVGISFLKMLHIKCYTNYIICFWSGKWRVLHFRFIDISSKVAVTPSTSRISFGDTSRFYCAVKQSTPTAVVRWKKQGERGFIKAVGRFTLTPGGALQIADSKFEDQGQYACIAENAVTSAAYKSANAGSLQVTAGTFSYMS